MAAKKKNQPSHRPKRTSAVTKRKIAALTEFTLQLFLERDTIEAELKRFHEEDQPRFTSWVDQEFSGEMAEIDALHQQLYLIREALNQTLHVFMTHGALDFEKELARAQSEIQQAFEEADEADDQGQGNDQDTSPPEDLPDDLAEEMLEEYLMAARGIDAMDLDDEEWARAKADFLDSLQHAREGNFAAFERNLLQVGADDSSQNVSRVKAIYRRLARTLHPDQSDTFDEHEKRLWHEASVAYQALDHEALENVEVELHLRRGSDMPTELVPPLKRTREDLQETVDRLRCELARNRDTPAWGFAHRKITKKWVALVARDLKDEIRELHEDLVHIQEEIQYYQRMFHRPAKRRANTKRKSAGKKAASKKTSAKKAAAKRATSKKTAARKMASKKTAARPAKKPEVQEEFDF